VGGKVFPVTSLSHGRMSMYGEEREHVLHVCVSRLDYVYETHLCGREVVFPSFRTSPSIDKYAEVNALCGCV
jgi:hypothetical protein